MLKNTYKNKKILITGNTGFKGSWLSAWLQVLGANILGVSLPPKSSPNHWELLNTEHETQYLDIRESQKIAQVIRNFGPDLIFHLAAQSLVLESYEHPLETWSTNVLGTANVLNACRSSQNLAAIVVITSDKCYENNEQLWGYRECDPLGGGDPYSASKAATELVSNSYRKSFFNAPGSPLIATARAGNVIGGGGPRGI